MYIHRVSQKKAHLQNSQIRCCTSQISSGDEHVFVKVTVEVECTYTPILIQGCQDRRMHTYTSILIQGCQDRRMHTYTPILIQGCQDRRMHTYTSILIQGCQDRRMHTYTPILIQGCQDRIIHTYANTHPGMPGQKNAQQKNYTVRHAILPLPIL